MKTIKRKTTDSHGLKSIAEIGKTRGKAIEEVKNIASDRKT